MSRKEFEEFINAVKHGEMTVVENLCRNDWIDKEDDDGYQAIHLASAEGHVAVVKFLLKAGCQIDATDRYGLHPIHWASANGHASVVKYLLKKRAQIETSDLAGRRPIHLACCNGQSEIAQLLVDEDCEIEIKTNEGETPLDLSKEYKRDECTKIIERAQAFLAARKDDLTMFQSSPLPLWTKEHKTGETLLDVIIQTNAKFIIEFIECTPVTDKVIIDFLSLDRKGFSIHSYELLQQLFVNCCIRHNNDWAFLRLCSADVVNTSPLPDGTTFLDTAVKYRRSLCVRHILQKHVAFVDSWDRAREEAAMKMYEEIVEMIQDRQTILRSNTWMSRNRLHLAVIERDVDMVKYILSRGLANHSEKDCDGNTPLMMAVTNRMVECANIIRKHGANVTTVNKHGQTILHVLVANRMKALPQWLISGPYDVNQRDCMGLTALQQAVVADMESIAAQLVQIKSDHSSIVEVNMAYSRHFKNIQIVKPLEYFKLSSQENSSSLCLKLHGRIYPCFLNNFTRDDANFFDGNGNSLLHLTALLMNADSCKRLLEKGAAVGAINGYRNTPLVELIVHMSVVGVNDRALMTLQCLIDAGASITDEHDSGKTALQMAMELLDENMLIQMVQHTLTINRITSNEFDKCLDKGMFQLLGEIVPKLPQTIAHKHITVDIIKECVLRKQFSTMKIIFTHAKRDIQDKVIDLLLRYSAVMMDVESFSGLLRLRGENWARMSNGDTILNFLIKKKMWRFCQIILETRTASKLLELTDVEGNSPLIVAINTEAEELIERLIVETNDVDFENNAGHTALSLLLEKVSSATEDRLNQLKLWIKQLIKSSADIYRMNKHNKVTINFCTSEGLRTEFEMFYDNLSKQNRKRKTEDINMCGVCSNQTVNRFLDACGHTLCTECADAVVNCPFCRAPIKRRKRMVLP